MKLATFVIVLYLTSNLRFTDIILQNISEYKIDNNANIANIVCL